jgi:hypothetical protein
MKIYQLIWELLQMPWRAEVSVCYDGASRMSVERIWLSRNGRVAISDADEYVYNDEDRPAYAPTEKQERFWRIK